MPKSNRGSVGQTPRGGRFRVVFRRNGDETANQSGRDADNEKTFGVDTEATQRSKLWTEIPPVDVVITMGCDVERPFLRCERRDDWGLPAPTGKPDATFVEIIREIERRIVALKVELGGAARF